MLRFSDIAGPILVRQTSIFVITTLELINGSLDNDSL
jgi:hypothetical protein